MSVDTTDLMGFIGIKSVNLLQL